MSINAVPPTGDNPTLKPTDDKSETDLKTERKEKASGNKKTIVSESKGKDTGNTQSLGMPLLDELESIYNVKFTDSVKKEIAKILANPMEKNAVTRALVLFLKVEQDEFTQQLGNMENQKNLVVASLHKQSEQEKTIGNTQMVSGIVSSSATLGMGLVTAGSSMSSLAKARSVNKDFDKIKKPAEESIQKLEKQITEKEKDITKLQENIKQEPPDSPKSQVYKDQITDHQNSIKGYKTEIGKYNKTIDTAKGTRDVALNELNTIASRNHSLVQVAEGLKGLADATSSKLVSIQRANLKIEEATQVEKQLFKDNARMFMQRANDFVNGIWGTAKSVIDSHFSALKAVIAA